MKLKFITSILGSVVLTLSIPTTLTAQTADFGTTRTPQSCPSRAEPKTGAISVAQAKKYFTCHIERGDRFNGKTLNLVTNLDLQIASQSRRANQSDVYRAANLGTPIPLDPNKPVYDIRGSYTSYLCNRYVNPVKNGTNCLASNMSAGKGICFKDTFGDWFCLMTASISQTKQQVPPPQ